MFETGGEQLRKAAKLKDAAPQTDTTPPTPNPSPLPKREAIGDDNKRGNTTETTIPIATSRNRVAIRNFLRMADAQRAYEAGTSKTKVIKAGYYKIGENILIGGDPEPKTSAPIERPLPPPPPDVPIIEDGSKPNIPLVELDPKPDIAPLPDEITPRIKTEHTKKS